MRDVNAQPDERRMNHRKILSSTAAMILPLAIAMPATAQNAPQPWAQMQTSSAIIGLGGQSGDGQLTLPNLGTNCVYPFTVSGFGAGIQVGISRISAAGPVGNLNRLEDFSGNYNATHGEATIIAGGGSTSMQNKATGVTLDLSSQTAGLNIGISGQGMTVNMPLPPAAAPRSYVFEFGFNKDWLNKANKAQLDQLLAAWKCRYVKIRIVGHTDAVGKEDDNLQLATHRAEAVRDYLIGGGLYPTRIEPMTAGENNQQVSTQQEVRLRANRVVVVTIE
jgi:outer membrane protein OmpA-like peptidoglycan-associated protein